MDIVTAAVWTIHVAFASLWTGSVLFVTVAVLPRGVTGEIGSDVLGGLVGKLRTITRVSALLLLLTGGHMAAALYTAESLTGSGRGHVVLTMLVLWFLLAGAVEAGSGRLQSGLDDDKLREPARDARPVFYAAAVLAVLLLGTAGILATPGAV